MSADIADDMQSISPRRSRRGPLIALAAVAVLLAIAYASSPAVSALRLLQAARAADLAAIDSRIDFPRLRRSVARQLVSEAVRARQLQGLERQLAIGAGTAAVAVWLEALLSPQTIADALAGRAPTAPASDPAASRLAAFRLAPVGSAFDIWLRSGFTGLMSYDLVLAEPASNAAVTLGMELRGTRWRVTSVGIPNELRDELAREAAAILAARRAP